MSLIAITMMGYLPFQLDTPDAPLWWPEHLNGVNLTGTHTSYQSGSGLLDSSSVTLRWAAPVEDWISGPQRQGLLVCADVDGDGQAEILIRELSGLAVYDGSTGTKEWEFTQAVPSEQGGITIGDVDGDGRQEILFIARSANMTDLYAVDGVSRNVDWIFPGTPTNYPMRAALVSDLDGDGIKEVLVDFVNSYASDTHKIVCLNGRNGMAKWINQFNPYVRMAALMTYGDLDWDGIKEVVGVVDGLNGTGIATFSGLDGSFIAKSAPDFLPSGMCVSDVDRDGVQEIVGIGTYSTKPCVFSVNGLNGQVEWCYIFEPVCLMNLCPAIGQLDDDSALEVVSAIQGNNLLCLDGASGNMEWLVTTGPNSSSWFAPVIGDVDGDGRNEIISLNLSFPSNPSFSVYCFSEAGQVEWVYAPERPPDNTQGAYHILADVDDDNFLEVVAIFRGYGVLGDTSFLFVLDNERALPTKEEKALRPPTMLVLPDKLVLSLPRTYPVELTLYDMTGRKVQELYKGPLPAGTHEFELRGLEPGVYLAELRYDGRITTKAVVMRR